MDIDLENFGIVLEDDEEIILVEPEIYENKNDELIEKTKNGLFNMFLDKKTIIEKRKKVKIPPNIELSKREKMEKIILNIDISKISSKRKSYANKYYKKIKLVQIFDIIYRQFKRLGIELNFKSTLTKNELVDNLLLILNSPNGKLIKIVNRPDIEGILLSEKDLVEKK